MKLAAGEFRNRLLPITLSQAVGLLCGLGGVRVVSHLLPPALLGHYGVFLSFSTLGIWLIHSGLIKYVGRMWAAAPDHSALLHGLRRAWLKKLPWLALATAVAALFLRQDPEFPFHFAFPILLVASAFLSIAAIGQAALQAEKHHWRDLIASSVGSLTRTFVPPYLFLALQGRALALYGGFVFHSVLFAAAAVFTLPLRKAGPPTASRPAIDAVYEGPLFFVLALASWSLTGLNRWLSVWRFGETTGGYLTLGGNIAGIVAALIGAIFVQFFQPGFYALGDKNAFRGSEGLLVRVDRVALGFALLCGLLVLALRGVAPVLIGPLIDPKYTESLVWLIPTGFFALSSMAAYFYHLLLLAGRRERACAQVDLVTALLLAAAAVVGAFVNASVYRWALTGTPLIVFLVTRPLARRAILSASKPIAAPSLAPAKTSGE